ncbi:MAG TPA: glycosyl transferase [Rikenellaceae bacterium]|nr:glycosyl transferase [Rikenellaceae bacterium]
MDIVSIIIPAHNEEKNIGRLLEKLVTLDNAFQIIVVCNGCTDATATVVRDKFPSVLCIETKIASKTRALQIGDFQASFWPRVYIDADVEITAEHIYALVKEQRERHLAVITPFVENNLKMSSFPVRAFYNIWSSLEYYKEGMIGSGIYSLSEYGRSQFYEWPDLISDDGYIRALFGLNERGVCKKSCVIIHAPKTFAELIKTKTRSRLGRYQLQQKFPEIFREERKSKNYVFAFLVYLRRPGCWLDLIAYFLVNLITRIRAKRQMEFLDTYRWEKDLSTR